MALNEDFSFTTRFRGGENDDVVDTTVYKARRTLEGYTVVVHENDKLEYGVHFNYNHVIALLNEGEWIIEYDKE